MKLKYNWEYNRVWIFKCPLCKAMGTDWRNGKDWLLMNELLEPSCPKCKYKGSFEKFATDTKSLSVPDGCLLVFNERQI